MKQNIRLTIIYLVGVMLPVVLLLINGYIADKNTLSWNYDNEKSIFIITLITAILFCTLTVYLNYRAEKKGIWYTLSITSVVALLLLLYFGISISSLGF